MAQEKQIPGGLVHCSRDSQGDLQRDLLGRDLQGGPTKPQKCILYRCLGRQPLAPNCRWHISIYMTPTLGLYYRTSVRTRLAARLCLERT